MANINKADMRECGMMGTFGLQGVGKTYQNMHLIAKYVRDKIYSQVEGRKALIFDTNGEYTAEEFKSADIDIEIKKIKLADVGAFGASSAKEVRRIDASMASIDQKLAAVKYIMETYRNGLLALEDINTYTLNISHTKDIVSGLVNLRHRAVDIIISYQGARAVEPRIWTNSRWFRMHYQPDNILELKDKIPNVELYMLAQILVETRYFNQDKRFFVYVHNFTSKIEGNFSEKEFLAAAEKYLLLNQTRVKQHMKMYKTTEAAAIKHCQQTMLTQYYGN